MNVLIIEDEESASIHLQNLLQEIDPQIIAVKVLDSIKSALKYLKQNTNFELIFMDVHLADGLCFEIFKKIEINKPIIFTSAYDQYALDAFSANSIHYVLKPITYDSISTAVHKFKQFYANKNQLNFDTRVLLNLLQAHSKKYIRSLLIYSRNGLIPIDCDEFADFYMDEGIVRGVTFNNITYTIDKKMSELEEDLDPCVFFRVSRQFIINIRAIKKIQPSAYGKSVLQIKPNYDGQIVVSKAKTPTLKKWIEFSSNAI